MKKSILGFLVLCFSVQAYSAEPVVKTGSIWLDQEYKIEVTYFPEQQDAKLTSVKTSYTPCEQDCNYLRPAQCWTNLQFELGMIQVRIISGDKELIKETSKMYGSASLTREPLDYNVCEQNLPAKGTYSVYPLQLGKPIIFSSGQKKFRLDIQTLNVVSINLVENEIQLPVQVNLTKIDGWKEINDQHLRLSADLHTATEWAKIKEDEKNQPAVDYSDKD